MSKHYKLIIENKHKKIIQENLSDYSLDDVKTFLSDIYKITTNTVAATAISVGAQLEHAVLTTHGWNHFDLTFINETFLKKIEEANKLYNESIPQSVKGEVEYLAAIDNPSLFVGKKLLEFALFDKGKNLDMYVPFYSFIKRNFSGEFFKTDIVKFGEWLGGIVKLNNIVWYIGWVCDDIMNGAKDFMKEAMQKGLLSESGIKGLKGIKTTEQLIARYPDVALFIKAYDGFQVITGSNRTYYGFLKRNEKRLKDFMYYSSMVHYHHKGGFYLSLKRAYETIEENKKLIQNERDPEIQAIYQQEIDELTSEYREFLEKKFGATDDDNDGYTFADVEQLSEEVNQSLIKIYDDNQDEDEEEDDNKMTMIDAIIATAENENKLKPSKKEKQQILESLKSHREFLKEKYGENYKKEKFNNNQQNDLYQKMNLIRSLYAEISQHVSIEKDPTTKIQKILDDYFADLERTSKDIIDQEINLFPNLITAVTSDEFKKRLVSKVEGESKKAVNVLTDVFGAFITDARKKIPAIDTTLQIAESAAQYLQTLFNIKIPKLP